MVNRLLAFQCFRPQLVTSLVWGEGDLRHEMQARSSVAESSIGQSFKLQKTG